MGVKCNYQQEFNYELYYYTSNDATDDGKLKHKNKNVRMHRKYAHFKGCAIHSVVTD